MKPSALATCQRVLDERIDREGSWVCGKPLRLFITKSPVLLYDELVVLRCPEHIESAQGVSTVPYPIGPETWGV